MRNYIGKRLIMAAASLMAVLFLLFLLMDLLPGSPFHDEKLTAEQIGILEQAYGLNRPFFVRLFTYAGKMLRGDLGVSYSIAKDIPVMVLIKERLPVSFLVGGLAVLTGGLGGIFLGMAAAAKKNSILDKAVTAWSVAGVSFPSYVLALAFAYVFGFRLGWFPILYRTDAPVWSSLLPAAALGMYMAASTSRVMRTELAAVLESEYIIFAESRGVPGWRRLLCHGLKNALVPVVALLSPMAASVMTGSLAVEKIFSIPGTGSLMVTAIQANDYNVVAGLAFIYSGVYIMFMLAADLLYELLDPRIKVR